jgi:hypothetical protein
MKEPLPGNLQRIFKFHDRTDMGNTKTAEWPDDFDQCLFIRRIKYRYRYVPADKQVPVDELHFLGISEVLPELDHLVGIFRSEFEPKNKQHISSPHSFDYPWCPELRERIGGKGEKARTLFQDIDR